MKKRLVFIVAVLAGLSILLAGCGGAQFSVNVSALKDPQASERRTYVLAPGIKGLEPNDLQFKEFAACVQRALGAKGFVPVEGGSHAELVIFLSYGIGEPKTTHYSYPVYGEIGGGKETFSAVTYGPDGYVRTTGTVESEPQYGIVGTRTGSQTEYFRWATVEAVDADEYLKTGKTVPLWRVNMTSSGTSDDLRIVFPAMIAAGQPYFATDTGKQVSKSLGENSSEIRAIRGEKKH